MGKYRPEKGLYFDTFSSSVLIPRIPISISKQLEQK